ncbi:MAG TPA: hypothetical protein VIV60_12365, partial [Polyangiaceae bacterium]
MTRHADPQSPLGDERRDIAVQHASADLAGALHDVSNALTVVVGWLEVALGRTAPNEVVEAIDVALSHARFGHRVARRAIGGAVESELTCASLDEIIGTSFRAVEPLAQRRQIRVEFEGNRSSDVALEAPDAAT